MPETPHGAVCGDSMLRVRYPGFGSKSAFFSSNQSLFSVLLAEIPQPKTPVLLGLWPVVLFFQVQTNRQINPFSGVKVIATFFLLGQRHLDRLPLFVSQKRYIMRKNGGFDDGTFQYVTRPRGR